MALKHYIGYAGSILGIVMMQMLGVDELTRLLAFIVTIGLAVAQFIVTLLTLRKKVIDYLRDILKTEVVDEVWARIETMQKIQQRNAVPNIPDVIVPIAEVLKKDLVDEIWARIETMQKIKQLHGVAAQ